MKFYRLMFVALCFALVGSVAAQDEDSENPLRDLYDDIPQARADDGAFVLGDPNAPVTIIEFADYLCPHCQDYHEETVAPFIEEYVATGQAKFEYRFVPIIDPSFSPLMSALTECAAEQDAFWGAHALLYEMARDQEIGAELATNFSERLGVDFEQISDCVNGARQYETDADLANELGVSGTPAIRVRVGDNFPGALFVDGQVLSGGGVPLEILAMFVESDDPESMVRSIGQLRNDRLLQDTSLIDSEPCEAPCWRGITPGETSWQDAVEIIEADEQFADFTVQQSDQSAARRALWSQVDGDPCCEMFSNDGETVAFIRLLLAPDVTMGQVIEEHGDPAYLLGSESTPSQAIFTIFYEDPSMLLFAFIAGAETGELTEDSEIIAVQYLDEGAYRQLVESNPLYEWDGYGSFAEYIDGQYDVLPGNAP